MIAATLAGCVVIGGSISVGGKLVAAKGLEIRLAGVVRVVECIGGENGGMGVFKGIYRSSLILGDFSGGSSQDICRLS